MVGGNVGALYGAAVEVGGSGVVTVTLTSSVTLMSVPSPLITSVTLMPMLTDEATGAVVDGSLHCKMNDNKDITAE